VGAATFLDFDQLFLTFHETVFHNNYWQLDPATDHLIQMFPFDFWYDAMVTVALRVVLAIAIIGLCGLLLARTGRTKSRVMSDE
jgi:integral membrane protein (TIGR01906 family)